ncbi:MAG: hypothetical protein ACQERD_00460 [Campylobacterota bacterium]
MQKLFLSLTLVIVVIITSILGLLFTSAGNSIIATYIEDTVNQKKENVNFKVESLALGFNTFDFKASFADDSIIDISGDLKIIEKVVDLKYKIDIKDLSNLQNLTNQKLNGPFFTSGTFVGNNEKATINGNSNVASSDTSYLINMINFEPSSIKFDIKDAMIEELLYLVNQPLMSSGRLNVSANIKNAKPNSLDGTIVSTLLDGKVNNKFLSSMLNKKITTDITYKSRTNAVLKGNKVEANSSLVSSLGTLVSKKTVINLDTSKLQSRYNLNINDLSKLEDFIDFKLNGEFSTFGDLVANNNIIKISGTTPLFKSLTKYDAKIVDSKVESLNLDMTNAKLKTLLYTLNQPSYAKGNLDLNANITSLDLKNLEGKISSNITDGVLNNSVINKQFDQKLKDEVEFRLNSNTNLKGTEAISEAALNSSVANLNINSAVFDVNKQSFKSKYLLDVPKLSKLYDITSKKLRGAVELNGDINSTKDSLTVTGVSQLLGGSIDFKLQNDDLVANINDLEIKELTNMLYYPEVFDSKSDLNIDYNLASKSGKIKGRLIDGHFLENEFSTLINQFAKFDLTREVYKTVDISSDINDMVLKSVISMKSKNTQIDVTKSVLDLNNSFLDANIKAKIRKTTLAFDVKGDMQNPSIKLDTKNTLRNKIEQEINEKIGNNLKEKVGEEGAKEIINNFKSLF